MAALAPGLLLATCYLIYITTISTLKPELAPPLPRELLYVPKEELPALMLKSFLCKIFCMMLTPFLLLYRSH